VREKKKLGGWGSKKKSKKSQRGKDLPFQDAGKGGSRPKRRPVSKKRNRSGKKEVLWFMTG